MKVSSCDSIASSRLGHPIIDVPAPSGSRATPQIRIGALNDQAKVAST